MNLSIEELRTRRAIFVYNTLREYGVAIDYAIPLWADQSVEFQEKFIAAIDSRTTFLLRETLHDSDYLRFGTMLYLALALRTLAWDAIPLDQGIAMPRIF